MFKNSGQLMFSPQPGMHERQLRRKINNTLFGQCEVIQPDIIAAQLRDNQELEAFIPEFNQLIQDVAGLTGHIETEKLDKYKEQLDRLYVVCSCLPGDVNQFKQAIRKLIGIITATVLSNSNDDPMALQKLEEENASRLFHYDLQDIHLLADITHPDSPVTENELVATLLDSEISELEKVLPIFTHDQLMYLHKEAETLLNRLEKDSHDIHAAKQNLDVIGRAIKNTIND